MGSYLSYIWSGTDNTEITYDLTEGTLDSNLFNSWCLVIPTVQQEYDYTLDKNHPQTFYSVYVAVSSGAKYDPSKEILSITNADGTLTRYKLV